MHDIFGKPSPAQWNLSDFHLKRMVLSPDHWRNYKTSLTLKWERVQFSRENASQIPDDSVGVYTFLVQPGIAQHPECSYLLYVGKTERSFRSRYDSYLSDWKKGDRSTRPHVTEMLEKWQGFLWFSYAPITQANQIITVEDALLAAFLPPVNRDFPANVSTSVKRLFAT